MHRKGWFNRIDSNWFINHQLIHHPAYREDFRSSHPPENAKVGIAINWITTIIFASPLIFMIGWFLSLTAAVSFVLMGMIHNIAWTVFHEEMHIPKGAFYSKWVVYKFLYNYHVDHHNFPKQNFNVVYPFADWILGTLH
jgi:hypothetical protein